MLVDKTATAANWIILAGFLLMRRSDLQRQVNGNDLRKIFICMAAAIAFMVFLAGFELGPKLDRITHEPGYVIPFWVVIMGILILSWRKERKVAMEASQVG
jgi:uncharacterized membrane protein